MLRSAPGSALRIFPPLVFQLTCEYYASFTADVRSVLLVLMPGKKNKRRTSTGSPRGSNSKCLRVTEMAAAKSQDGAAINSQDGVGAEKVSAVTLKAIMDTINSLGVKMEDNFKSLREEMEIFKCELKVDLDKLRSTVVELEKSSTALSQRIDELEKSNTSYNTQMSLQQTEIEDLKKQLANEKERVLHLEEYSRRENLKFRNIPELPEVGLQRFIAGYYI